jgi:hypothetical protein
MNYSAVDGGANQLTIPTSNSGQESEHEMVTRLVRNGEARVAAQRKMIALLAARRLPLREAQEQLQLYEYALQTHVDRLAHIEDVARRSAVPRRGSGRIA